MDPLVDSYGRRITSMRISITDRCNFRCQYCMPADGLPWVPREDILTYEEIARIARVTAAMGVKKIRLTGGEPLARRDSHILVKLLRAIPQIQSVGLTTNGTKLDSAVADLAAAGLTHLNVSLDSLAQHKFFQITRRDALDRVLKGLEATKQFAQLQPVKINAVAMKGFTEEEVAPFAEFARTQGFIVRWIEFMPLDADQIWRKEDILTGAEIRNILEKYYGALVPLQATYSAETAKRYGFVDGVGEVGFINPVSEPFCASCDRIRLTAEGALRTCLFAQEETDLRSVIRNGADDDALEAVIRGAVFKKELKHYIGDKRFRRTKRTMSMIGG